MAGRTPIAQFVKDCKYNSIFICKSHSLKTSKTGGQYIDMQILDKSGEINGKCWNIPQNFDPNLIVDGDFIHLAVTIDEYNGHLQARIDNIGLVPPEYQFDKSELIPVAPEPAERMFNEVMNTINAMQNNELKRLCGTVIMENREALMTCPGAKSMHHAVLSGLLQHMTGMLRLGKSLLALYPGVSSDLLLSGIILHDICKPSEFAIGPVGLCTDYTKKGKLIGHITMGVSYIEGKCRQMNISEETTMLITHLILSHHGTPEFGSPVRPAVLEALLLNMIDNIDAKVYMAQDALNAVNVGEFTDRIFGLENVQLYKHGINNVSEYDNY